MINSLQLLTAKPVTYLVNLSERDYIRKKNKWFAPSFYLPPSPRLNTHNRVLLYPFSIPRLPKIKAWIDENNPGDPLIPFSVSLEERLAQLPDDEARAEEEKTIGATSNLPKITTAGYSSLEASFLG